jgi:PAS domain-containing protein
VNASGSSIPGDQLYPVKRTWEGVRLMFVFTPQGRDILESQYDQERLNEIDELLNMGRNATPISFSGLVTRQQDGSWTVSGIPVSVNDSTILPQEKITDSAPVFVIGITRSDGAVEAHQIQLLQPGAPLPPFEPSGSGEHGNLNPASTPIISSTPDTSATQSSEPGHSHTTYDFSGIVESMQDGIWTINGQPVHVDQNQVRGNVQIGSAVKFQGYYDSNGEFIVSNLDVTSNGDSATSHHNNNSNGNGSGSTTQGSGGDSGNGGGTPTGGSGDH